MLQVPVPSAGLMLPVQVSPLASSTVIVTLPVTCGAPATALATVKLTVTACSCSDGSGVSEVVVVWLFFFGEFNAHAKNCVPPDGSAQLLTVSTEPLRPCLTHTPPDRKSTRLNSSHIPLSRMPSSA